MSGRPLSRPSSAKRHIKYAMFSQFVSASRLRRVQDLLDSGAVDSPKKTGSLDAILCISGIDSRYNEGCYELINYLLFGFFEVRKAELERSGFSDDVVDDLMILIRKDRVDVYCNPVNWHYFLPYISHWTNISFHCLQEEEYDLSTDSGAEAAEDFKVESLIRMTSGCSRIGIPYYGANSDPEEHKFDKMLVEKWPIIQAFAMEDFKGGGFFTLKFEVADISDFMHELPSFQDPVSIEILATEKLPMMERQWKNMCDCMNMQIAYQKGVLSQAAIAEPLCSFYQHGQVGSHKDKTRKYKVPFALLGMHTAKSHIVSVESGGKVLEQEVQLGKNDSTVHMVCQVVSPKSPVTCARTYFVTHLFTGETVFVTSSNANPIECLELLWAMLTAWSTGVPGTQEVNV